MIRFIWFFLRYILAIPHFINYFWWKIGFYNKVNWRVGRAVWTLDTYLEKNFARDYLGPRLSKKPVQKQPFDFIIKQNKSLVWKEVIASFSRRQKTEFYAPLQSFWPLFLSFSLGLFLVLLVASFHNEKIIKFQGFFLLMLLISICIALAFWFSLFFLEKTQGNHNIKILDNIEMGFYLFLFTEALCFMSLFWVFLHSMLASSIHVGLFNPGEGVAHFLINETIYLKEFWDEYYFSEMGTPIYYNLTSHYRESEPEVNTGKVIKVHVNFYDKGQLLNPYKLPLLNTFILLSSAGFLNLSHASLKKSKFFQSLIFLFVTVFLGIFFVCVQYKEYKECTLQYNDGIYAACFFSLTGLHGFHVILGLVCLIICFFNILLLNYSSNFHQSFHYSIVYWHFVDIIWILVYFVIYLWPSSYFFSDNIYAVWLDFGHYSVHFDKKTFEKIVKSELFSTILNNDKNVIFLFFPEYTFSAGLIKNSKYISNKIFENNNSFAWKELPLTLLVSDENDNKDLNYLFEFDIKFRSENYEAEFYLCDWYNTKGSFNFNEIKKDPYAFCFVMNIMHYQIFDSTINAFFYDLEDNKKKMIVFCLLYKFSKTLCLTYIYYFMPYLFEYTTIRRVFKLIEFKKK